MSQLSKIISFQYQGQAADLLDAVATGLVGGYHINYDSNNQSWAVVNVGGNQITIQNGSTGTYASPSSEAEGAEVVGNPNPYSWQLVPVPGGWYQIATTDGSYVWFLTGSQDRAPIVLKSASYQGQDAQYGFEPVARVA